MGSGIHKGLKNQGENLCFLNSVIQARAPILVIIADMLILSVSSTLSSTHAPPPASIDTKISWPAGYAWPTQLGMEVCLRDLRH